MIKKIHQNLCQYKSGNCSLVSVSLKKKKTQSNVKNTGNQAYLDGQEFVPGSNTEIAISVCSDLKSRTAKNKAAALAALT